MLSHTSLNRDWLLLSNLDQRSFGPSGQGDLHVLTHFDRARTALREKQIILLLVKLDDQYFSSRPEGLILALRHYLLGVEENRP